MAEPVLINGVQHSYVDLKINISGVTIYGVTALNYGDSQDKEDVFALGRRAVGRGYGAIKADGSMTLLSDEVEKLQSVAPDGNILLIAPFDIVITGIPRNSNKKFTHTLRNCEFTKNKRDWKPEDKKNEVELPLIISDILWK